MVYEVIYGNTQNNRILIGSDADRPSSGETSEIYIDTTYNVIYRGTGTGWQETGRYMSNHLFNNLINNGSFELDGHEYWTLVTNNAPNLNHEDVTSRYKVGSKSYRFYHSNVSGIISYLKQALNNPQLFLDKYITISAWVFTHQYTGGTQYYYIGITDDNGTTSTQSTSNDVWTYVSQTRYIQSNVTTIEPFVGIKGYANGAGKLDSLNGVFIDGVMVNVGAVPLPYQSKFYSEDDFTILSNGNIGFGTTNPANFFEVAGIIAPSANNTYDLGTSSLKFKDIYAANDVKIDGKMTTAAGLLRKASVSPTPGVNDVYGSALDISPITGYNGIIPSSIYLAISGTPVSGETVTVRVTSIFSDTTTANETYSLTGTTGTKYLSLEEISNLMKENVYITKFSVDSKTDQASTTATTSCGVTGWQH